MMMKTFLIIFGSAIVIAGLILGFWILFSPATPTQTQGEQTTDVTFPPSRPPVVDQPNTPSSGTQSTIADAFRAQVSDSASYTLKDSIIVSDYGLQIWIHDEQGGEALFQKESAGGWKLVTMGGGSISTSSLVVFGMPPSVAEQLVAAEKKAKR